ncbi:MAG: carbamate kinase [Frankiales bacterium]|nr:carbamate kinase [Frankiales bacterium]
MRIVVALGGNALLRRGERPDATIQLQHVRAAADALAALAKEHQLLICHGNGPQVGLLALESEDDRSLTRAYPLDALVAQTQGMIGYWLGQGLRNAGVAAPVISVVTQVLVSAEDPAFAAPTKFVGAGYDLATATELARTRGWSIAVDGRSTRRVVPSPEPRGVIEIDTILALLRAGTLVICGGGGGAPVVSEDNRLRGVEAVVDKDLTASWLAVAAGADRLLVLTDVAAVQRDYGTSQARALAQTTLRELAGMTFPAGSMGPKIEACRRFVEVTGGVAGVGALTDAAAIVAGTAGTTIRR